METERRWKATYFQCQINAVAEMDSLKRNKLGRDSNFASGTEEQRATSQGHDARVCQILTFDQADSAQFGELSKMPNAGVGQSRAAGQVDVSDSVACLDELDDGMVGKIGAMAEVNVV